MAICHWTGGAPAVVDIWDLTLANTWAANDVARVTIGTKDLLITVGSSTLSAIAAEIIASINATAFDSPEPATGFSRNIGGQQIPEFTEVFAEEHPTNTAIVRIKALSPGVPVGVTAGETTAGSGTLVAANTVPASGPNFLDNADNYLGGALPVDNDTLYFDIGAVSCLYGLTYFRANNIDLNVYVSNDWTGQLGLPAVNQEKGYAEYRQRYFQYRGGSKLLSFVPGTSRSNSQGRCWIDLQDQAGVAITMLERRGSESPSVTLSGADASTTTNSLRVLKGSLAIEPSDAPTGATKYAAFSSIDFGIAGGDSLECIVTIGANARLYLATSMTVHSGTIYSEASNKLLTDELHVSVRGGSLEMRTSEVMTTFDVYAGATLFIVGTTEVDEIQLFGGTLDCRRGSTDGDCLALKVYAGASVFDPHGLYATVFDLIGCTLADVTLELPTNRLFDLSSAATP